MRVRVLGVVLALETADAGEDRCDDLVAQVGDGAGGLAGYPVAVGPGGFDDELFAAQFAQVVGGPAEPCTPAGWHRSAIGLCRRGRRR